MKFKRLGCGKITKKSKIDWLIQFKNIRLIVDNEKGTTHEQVQDIKFTTTGRGLPIFSKNLENQFKFLYKSNGEQKYCFIYFSII